MKKYKIIFLFIILYISTITIVNMLFTSEIDEQGENKIKWVTHTHEVITETKEYLSAITDMESGQRGYLLTNDNTYLEPYYIGLIKAKESFLNLSTLTSDNKSQVKRLELINKFMQLKFKELAETINIKNTQEAVVIVKRDDGKKYMDQIRRIIANFVNEEVNLLAKRKKELYDSSSTNSYIFKIITLLFISILFYFIYRQLSEKYEIQLYKENLELKLKEEIDKNIKKDAQLFQQSRHAQMGEMIGMIAHQWRQPLGSISSTSINLQMKIDLENFDLNTIEGQEKQNTYFLKELKNIDNLIQNLSTTIDDFRDFYKVNKKSVIIKPEDVIEKSLNIINSALVSDNVKVIKKYNYKEEIVLYDNEMMQVILNILKNAHDNFIEKNIANPSITITTKNRSICIYDNGGGISEGIIDKIFDPYFSTKDEKNGTGLGLYMSKIIVEEHHNAKLNVKNEDDGVSFIIEFK